MAKRSNRKQKKGKTLKTVLIVIASLLALFALAFILNRTGLLQTQYSSTYLTVQNVNLSGQNLVQITGVAGTGANQINFNVQPSQMNSYISNTGYQTTKAISGTITLVNPMRQFPATINSGNVFYNIADWKSTFIGYNCPSPPNSGEVLVTQANLLVNAYCFYGYAQGTEGTFTGQILDSNTLNVQIGSSSGSLYIRPINPQTSLTLNDGLTNIKWTGDLMNYNQISTPTHEVLFSSSSFNKLLSSDAWAQYVNSKTSIISNCPTGQVDKCITDFNNNLNQNILKDYTFNYINNVGAKSANFSYQGTNSIYFNVLLNAPSTLPTFIITLPATSVGLQQLSGQPKIVSCSSLNVNLGSGESSTQYAQVSNVGSQGGEFTAQITCNNGVLGVSNSQYVSAGQSVTMPITLSGVNTNTATQNNNCVLSVTDTNSQKSDTCNFNVGVTYRANVVCSPKAITCADAQTLRTCNVDGTAYTDTPCGSSATCTVNSTGIAKCVSSSTNGTTITNAITPADCKWYQDFVQSSNQVYNTPIIGIFHLGPATTVTENKCTTASWFSALIWLIIIGIVVGVIMLFIWIKRKIMNIGPRIKRVIIRRRGK